MIFGLVTETRSDPEYVRNIAFWVRKLFDLTQLRFETITATQEIRISRTIYLVDTTAGSITITLPPAKDAKGEWFLFKKMASAHSVIIEGNGAETIDGSANISFNVHYDVRKVASDGVQWYVIQP